MADNSLLAKIYSVIDGKMPELKSIRDFIYRNPEIGGTEEKASALLIRFLSAEGFAVTENYYGITYAFKAEYSSGKKGPVIGIFAEYDALPEIGHGCGHNIICTSALGAACGLKSVLDVTGGKVIVYGTPGEENLQTKTIMAPKGAFSEADVGIMAHPSGCSASSGHSRAIEALKVEFFGKTSHAGQAPELGINALDSAVMCYQMINQQKEYIPNTNVHGVIRDGGCKASIIPDYTCMEYLTRADSMEDLSKLRALVERCAEAAAKAVGCTCRISNFEQTNAAMLTNRHLADVFDRNLLLAGETELSSVSHTGSTDMADVSLVIPSIHPYVGLKNPALIPHSREMADATITEKGDICLNRAAKALAGTGLEVLTDSELLEAIRKEFSTQQR